MDDLELPATKAASSGTIGTTALGRLQLRVPDEDGFEEVTIERRWPDVPAARAWCERTIARARKGTEVLEIHVFSEGWRHARSWETTPSHPIPEALQVGIVSQGQVRWSELRSMAPRVTTRSYF